MSFSEDYYGIRRPSDDFFEDYADKTKSRVAGIRDDDNSKALAAPRYKHSGSDDEEWIPEGGDYEEPLEDEPPSYGGNTDGLRNRGGGGGRRGGDKDEPTSDISARDLRVVRNEEEKLDENYITVRITGFRKWFQSVRMFQLWAIGVKISIAFLMSLSLLVSFMHISSLYDFVSAIFYLEWITLTPTLRQLRLFLFFVISQLIVSGCHAVYFSVRQQAISSFDALFAWTIMPRTYVFISGVVTSASIGIWSFVRLCEGVHGDYWVPDDGYDSRIGAAAAQGGSANGDAAVRSFKEQELILWSGVLVLSLCYAMYIILIQERVSKFPSLQRRRGLQIKGIMPKCLCRGLAISCCFTVAWSIACALIGPRAWVRWLTHLARSFWLDSLFLGSSTSSSGGGGGATGGVEGGYSSFEWETSGPSSKSLYTLFCASFVIVSGWELGRSMVWVIMTSQVTMKTQDLLVAISDEANAYTQHMGFLYLDSISMYMPWERRKLFVMRKQASAWRYISKAIITTLEKMATDLCDLQQLRRPHYGGIMSRLFIISRDRTANAVAQNVQLCVWAAHSGASLAVNALENKEDEYGEVIRTLPDILNAMLALSIALQDYVQSKKPEVFVGSKEKVAALHGHQLARSQWIYLGTQLDTAIYRIISGYYEHMKLFKVCMIMSESKWSVART
eukprot:jgi/Bigna1/88439/estExt_fgenesh1_pg.C_320033